MSQQPPAPPPSPPQTALPGSTAKTPWWKPRKSWKWWTVTVVVAFLVLTVIVTVTAPPTKPVTATVPNSGVPSPSATAPLQATPQPTDKPTAKPTAAPTARPTARATSQPTARPALVAATCGAPSNPWSYNFCGGSLIHSPPGDFCSVFNCIPSFWTSTKGYVDECNDGTYSHSGGRSGACSYHGGERRPLYG